MPTKRILQIIPTLDRAGAEKQFTLLATQLPRSEFEVHTCALTRAGPYAADLEAAEIPLTVIGKRWKVDPASFWKLKGLVRRLQPDLPDVDPQSRMAVLYEALAAEATT